MTDRMTGRAATHNGVTLGRGSPLLTSSGAKRLLTRSEADEQRLLFAWRDTALARFPVLSGLVHVPNGGHRHKAVAAKLKAEGVSPGYPDLVLDVGRAGFFGWRGELKRVDGGRVSREQAAWHDWLSEQGYCVDVAHGWEAMRDCLVRYVSMAPTPIVIPPRRASE